MFGNIPLYAGISAALLLLGEKRESKAQSGPESEEPSEIRQVISINGTFDAGQFGWILSGGGEVVLTEEPDDDPFALLPDGGLVFLYQKVASAAPFFEVSFDFLTELVSANFPSPGGFPDTIFATMYFGPVEEELRPEILQTGASITLFDYDAVNGPRGVLEGAMLSESPFRPGWLRFEGGFGAIAGQPHLALTFQALDGNGAPGDSLFLVDNVRLVAVPEPSTFWLGIVVGILLVFFSLRTRGRTPRRRTQPQ